MSSIYDWSLTAADNATADADLTWAEGQAPSTVNNSARVMMKRNRELVKDLGGVIVATGTANGLLVSAGSFFTTLSNGLVISFRAASNNTGAATLNVNGTGAKSIRIMTATGDTAIPADILRANGIYVAHYSTSLNGGAGGWLLLNAMSTTQLSGSIPPALISGSYPGITGTGALNAGSITSGFGSIDIGASAFSGGSLVVSGVATGSLRHAVSGNYMLIGSFNATTYGDGSARVWWNENDKNLTIDGGAGSVASVIAGEFRTIGGVGFTGPGTGLTGVNAATMSGISVVAGNGLTGGGALSASRTITMGLPGAITTNSTDAVTTNSHTHSIPMASQAQAEAGSSDTVLMTPFMTAKAITTQALVVSASAPAAAVGTYGFFEVTGGLVAPGGTAAGSRLRYAAADASIAGGAPPGVWMILGRSAGDGGVDSTTLCKRIS